MGCFDTLLFECPSCKAVIEFQSKIHECSVRGYTLKDAPLLVIADANRDGELGDLYCSECGEQLELEVRFVAVPKLKSKKTDEDWRIV